jgi:acetyltransferase
MNALARPTVAGGAADAPYRIHRYPSALIETLTLRDGRPVLLRPVLPQDDAALQAFVEALSPQARRLRFHGAVKWLPASALSALTAVDYRQHVALVAEVPPADRDRVDDGAPAQLVAEARYVRDGRGGAEFALAVADAWQGRGLGAALLERLRRHARSRGVAPLVGTVLADNHAMLALASRLGARIRDDARDASIVHVRLLD